MKITLEKLALAALIGYGIWKITQKPAAATLPNGNNNLPPDDTTTVKDVPNSDISQYWQTEIPPKNYAPVIWQPGGEGPAVMQGFFPSGLPGARPYMPYGVRWVAANRMKDTTIKAKMVL